MKYILVAKDNKNKIRVINLWTTVDKDGFYTIHRESGLKGGKLITNPDIVITKGKVKRTIEQQCELQVNSELKKYLDKGYKFIQDFGCNSLSDLDDNLVLQENRTDQNGNMKPMLCKVYDQNDKKTQAVNRWLASYKLDGLRTCLYWDGENIRSASRGGQDYDIATTYIRQDPYLISIFKANPKLKLDGELYHHQPGVFTLQKISGLGRLETLHEDHKKLEFYCYDIIDESLIFDDRNKILNDLRKNCPNNSKLVVIPQIEVHNHIEIMNLHNVAIEQGYEGLVIRNPQETYKCGGRDRRMQKIKIFQDSEHKILGLVEGLRDEDLCFLMETPEHYQFKAKPIGTREDKQYYREHINEFIGKMGTIKHFGYTNTEHPVPNLPVFRQVRLEKDIDHD